MTPTYSTCNISSNTSRAAPPWLLPRNQAAASSDLLDVACKFTVGLESIDYTGSHSHTGWLHAVLAFTHASLL